MKWLLRISSPSAVVLKLGQFHSPHFACAFWKILKAVGPFYLEVKYPTWGKCVTFRGLTLEKETSTHAVGIAITIREIS